MKKCINSKRKLEFSKLIMVSVMLTYFIAMTFVMVVTWKLINAGSASIGTAISSLCTFVGAPVAVAIGFYSYKAKAENVEKIKYSREDTSIGRDLDEGECNE